MAQGRVTMPRLMIRSGDLAGVVAGLRLAREAADQDELMATGTRILLEALRAEAPVRTGRLRRSLVARDGGVWGIAYGKLVAMGTRPHLITPRRGSWLVFRKDGRLIFARRVHHPGSRPNDFPARAVKQARPALHVLLTEDGRRLVRLIRGQSGGTV